MTTERFSTLHGLLGSRIVLAVTLVLIVAVSLGITRELVRRSAADAEIAQLEAEATRLEAQRRELEGLLAFLNTSTFQEEEARVKLNLRQPGETVVIVPPAAVSSGVEPAASTFQASNAQKWWTYFFSN